MATQLAPLFYNTRLVTELRTSTTALTHQATELAAANATLVEKDRLLHAFHQIGQIILSSLDAQYILGELGRDRAAIATLRERGIAS